MKRAVVIILIAATAAMASLTNCSNPESTEEVQSNDTVPLTKHWESAIPHQEIPEGLESLSAEECGSCHEKIYEEWKRSTHALAFRDIQFQAEWKKDDTYVCLNCHTPLQNQQEYIVSGLIGGDYKKPVQKPNPHFDKQLQNEGITCASCHVRDGNVIGVTGIMDAPHNTVKDVEFLSQKMCIACHNVTDVLNPVLVCTFETGDEWESNQANNDSQTCISCHMAEMERAFVSGYEKRVSHSHYFAGSGIPKFFDVEAEGLNGLEITSDSVKDEYSAGETLHYSLVVKNSFAGHYLPTGDPERFFLISFEVQDGDGNVLKEKQYRIGEEWQWEGEAKKLSDNNLKPMEERVFDFSYQVPEKDGLTLVVEITKHRMNEENAEYMKILGKYPLSIGVFERSYSIRLN